jgi:putative transposase
MASVLALSVPPPNRVIVPFVTSNLEMLQRPLESNQFTNGDYQRFLADHHILSSMSAVGHCADNAAAEDFFGMIKRERIYRQSYLTLADARSDVFDYIESFHNPRMQHRIDARDQAFTALTQLSAKPG